MRPLSWLSADFPCVGAVRVRPYLDIRVLRAQTDSPDAVLHGCLAQRVVTATAIPTPRVVVGSRARDALEDIPPIAVRYVVADRRIAAVGGSVDPTAAPPPLLRLAPAVCESTQERVFASIDVARK